MGFLDKLFGKKPERACDYCGAPIVGEPVMSDTGLAFCDDKCRQEYEGIDTVPHNDDVPPAQP